MDMHKKLATLATTASMVWVWMHHSRGHSFPIEKPPRVADGTHTHAVEELVKRIKLHDHLLARYIFQEIRSKHEHNHDISCTFHNHDRSCTYHVMYMLVLGIVSWKNVLFSYPAPSDALDNLTNNMSILRDMKNCKTIVARGRACSCGSWSSLPLCLDCIPMTRMNPDD